MSALPPTKYRRAQLARRARELTAQVFTRSKPEVAATADGAPAANEPITARAKDPGLN